jgi:hypothetical protein
MTRERPSQYIHEILVESAFGRVVTGSQNSEPITTLWRVVSGASAMENLRLAGVGNVFGSAVLQDLLGPADFPSVFRVN